MTKISSFGSAFYVAIDIRVTSPLDCRLEFGLLFYNEIVLLWTKSFLPMLEQIELGPIRRYLEVVIFYVQFLAVHQHCGSELAHTAEHEQFYAEKSHVGVVGLC